MDVIVGPVLRLSIAVVELYIWVVVAAVILSWLTNLNVVNVHNRFVYMIVSFVYATTEPALRRIRGFMPDLGGFDISPIILIFALVLISDILAQVHHKVVY